MVAVAIIWIWRLVCPFCLCLSSSHCCFGLKYSGVSNNKHVWQVRNPRPLCVCDFIFLNQEKRWKLAQFNFPQHFNGEKIIFIPTVVAPLAKFTSIDLNWYQFIFSKISTHLIRFDFFWNSKFLKHTRKIWNK